MSVRSGFVFLLVATILAVASASGPFPGCSGSAKYQITFVNFLTGRIFRGLIPPTGLSFSPIAGISHSNRQSFLTIRGFATGPIEEIAETGDNSRLIRLAKRLRRENRGVKSIVDAGAGTPPGRFTTIELEVDCENPFVTVVAMIAPSPDWIVQINNRNLFDEDRGEFINFDWDFLIAYDAGTDSGREFTDPSDPNLDIPTEPADNIAPLVEDETDRFEGRNVGKYIIKRVA